jgi:hypothetical protein
VTASPPWFVPVTVSDPVTVIEVVGYVPISPLIVVGPVSVVPAPARTAKLSAVPSGTDVAAAAAPPTSVTSIPSTNNATRAVAHAARERKRLAPGRRSKIESIMFGLP